MGLAAAEILEAGYSYGIAKVQWKEEARQLFQTSLTRIQINARNIAQGTASRYGAQRINRGRKKFATEPLFSGVKAGNMFMSPGQRGY